MILLVLCRATYADDTALSPDRFVQTLLSDLVATGGGPSDSAVDELRALLSKSLDADRISIGVLGKYREALSTEEVTQFETVLVSSFADLIGRALGSLEEYELTITDVKEKSGRAQVRAIMMPTVGGRYDAVVSLGAAQDNWLVQNLTLNGVNLGLTYRNQFASLMEENGNNFASALEAWSREMRSQSTP